MGERYNVYHGVERLARQDEEQGGGAQKPDKDEDWCDTAPPDTPDTPDTPDLASETTRPRRQK